MLKGARVNRQTDPWTWEGPPGVMAWSDASGVAGQVGWSWGAVVALPGRSDSLLVHGECPHWVTEPTAAELWGMVEAARLIIREKGPCATAALVCDNTHAVFAAVSLLRGAVPQACMGQARVVSEAVLRASLTGEGDKVAAMRAKAGLELLALGRPTVLRCARETPELQVADELARFRGGFRPRRDGFVQQSRELKHFIYR